MPTRKTVTRSAAAFILFATLAASAAYAALPGYHRALTPSWFGLTQIDTQLWTDDPSRANELLNLTAQSEHPARAFFGSLTTTPRILLCTTPACAARFNLGPIAVTLGYHAILASPGGVTPMILAHERVHSELHAYMGLSDLFSPRFPAWFDEGLASHLSHDTRLTRPTDARDADWITSARTYRDWGRLHAPDGQNWRHTYGAAARLVDELDDTIGRDGLRALIADVANGADFDAAYERLIRK